MEYHKVYGPSVPEKGWVPAPRYLLRRQRLLDILTNIERCSLLEIGCGSGTLVFELSKRGFNCTALEMSESALEIASYVNQGRDNVTIRNKVHDDWKGEFDLVIACEVLEHIEDDRVALQSWKDFLKPGGLLLMTVPAHMSKWTDSDTWAGHYRRYERNGLVTFLEQCDFHLERFECYGYPLANMMEPIRARVHARELAKRDVNKLNTRKDNNAASGTARSTETRLYPVLCSWPGVILMKTAFYLQNRFLGTDIGNNYLVVARKK